MDEAEKVRELGLALSTLLERRLVWMGLREHADLGRERWERDAR